MAKPKNQKGVVVAALLVFAALLVLFVYSRPEGSCRGNVACYNDSGCPSWTYNQFCDANGSACINTTTFWCISPGSENALCALNATTITCTPCANGCANGNCLPDCPPGNLTPDLVVKEIAFQIVDNRTDVKLNLTVTVMNNGTGRAGQSVTLLRREETVLAQYPTPQLAPQQSVTLNPPATVVQVRGTTLTITALADAQNQVAELSETNNLFTLITR